MPWKIIGKDEVELWNQKLQKTDASIYQYPYYLKGEYSSLFYKTLFLKYIENNKELAFVAVIEIGVLPFKVGVVDDGPIILHANFDLQSMLEALKDFAREKLYMHLQIRPAKTEFENLLCNDSGFKKEVFFPFHKKEESEWNVYNQPEEELLASFKRQCRRKIVLAGREPFVFKKLEESNLKEVKEVFKQVSKTKGYQYIAFPSLLKIYTNGKKHNLSDIYGAYINNELVNVLVIIKDAQCFYHFTSALLVKGFKYNESPPAKLHLYAMHDCFYNEHKSFYNVSYGGTDNLIRFKELFNPIEVKKPPYYTYLINEKRISIFQRSTPESIGRIRVVVRNVIKHLKVLPGFCFLYSIQQFMF